MIKTATKKHLVSTVSDIRFLSEDYDTPPVWETMVFPRDPETGEVNYEDVECFRVDNEYDAVENHKNMVRKYGGAILRGRNDDH